MKWTQEMVARAKRALTEKYPYNGTTSDDIALILEAALADVPEPSDFDAGCFRSMEHNVQRMREQARRERARAEEAETKLAAIEYEQAMADQYHVVLERAEDAEQRVRELDAQITLLIAKESETCERAFRAEAKLAKVRAELDESEPMNDSEWRRALRVILDEEP